MRASRLASGPMPSGNSAVATTKKASTTATSPGRRNTSRRSRGNSAAKPLIDPRSKVRAPEIFERRMRGGDREAAIVEMALRAPRARLPATAASSAFKGSSSSQSGASAATTRASAARRRWPADSVRTARRRAAQIERRQGIVDARGVGHLIAQPLGRPAIFSARVRSPFSPSRWPSQASWHRQASRSAPTSAPCQSIVPASARPSRASARSRVVLPLPLRPVSTSNSPPCQ